MLILILFEDRWVKYNETILGSEGSDLNPFLEQNKLKSLKSDLYALTVLAAFEFLRFNKVSSWSFLIFRVSSDFVSDWIFEIDPRAFEDRFIYYYW